MSLFPRSQGDRGKERTEAAACKPTDRGCVCLRDGKGAHGMRKRTAGGI